MSSYNLHSWSKIPAEILQYTLRKIDNKGSIFNVNLSSVERVIYHTIALRNYGIQLIRLVNTLQSSEHLGKLVNKFDFGKIFYAPDRPWDPKGLFEKLSDCCPNVQTMTMAHSSFSLWLRLLTEQHRSNDFKLAEIDEFLNICPRQRCQYFRSFDKLQTCNPTLSNDTTIEELYLYSSEVNPAALYQLSVRLSNLKIMSFAKNEFISFNRSQLKGKKTIIDMPYTNFDKLVINQKRHRNFLHFFLKYSNETGDRYFYSELEPGVIKLLKCTMDDYTDKLNTVRDLVIIFDETIMTLTE
ncbi:hypothetical protein HPULCUR_008156 [Helicostylum pulchrum]|uniref:F-box domain-containing protein n=1 Tax=Helicostylum pulchrum TaxID=562976 RepID=A0ABP9Y6T4_9FUNG